MSDIRVYDDFQFSGHKWPLLADARGNFASFNRACQLLGLRFDVEWSRVQRYPEIAACTRIEYDVNGDPIHYVQAEAVPTWLLVIPPGEVPAATRRLRAEITRGLVPAIYSFVTRGVAIKDGTPMVAVLKEVGEYALKLNPSEKTRILVSSAIESELARLAGRTASADMPVTVASRLQERRIESTQTDRQKIGHDVAKRYRRRYGREPAVFDQIIDGAVRKVKSYTKADIAMIDSAIDDHYRGLRLRA